MNGEFQNWLQDMEQAAQDLEKFVIESLETTVEQMAETADAVMQLPVAIVEQFEEAVLTECDRFIESIDEWLAPPIRVYTRFDVQWDDPAEGWTESWYGPVEPRSDYHPACVGCRHYHGSTYGGNTLVCGMHPYGWDGTDCPDWEGK